MQFLVYILVYPFLWIISVLPFKLLYLFSDGVYVLIYHVIGYRKKTVTSNLRLVFPDKSKQEIASIRKRFYHHLCDMFLEMIKTMTISENELKKRFKITNPEEFKRLESLDKSVILIFGHYASWEWSIVIQNYINFKGFAVYKKLANTYFDKLVKRIRSKFNTTLISTKETILVINEHESKNIKSITGFISDQSPRLTKDVYFSTTYLKVKKVKRGFYEAEIITLAENSNDYPDYQLTDMFLKEVEKQIYEAPEYYFWTHKRWKHKRTE